MAGCYGRLANAALIVVVAGAVAADAGDHVAVFDAVFVVVVVVHAAAAAVISCAVIINVTLAVYHTHTHTHTYIM